VLFDVLCIPNGQRGIFHLCKSMIRLMYKNQVTGTNLDMLHPLESCPAAVLQIWPSYMVLLPPRLLPLGPVDRMLLHPSLLDHSLLPRQRETDEHG